jgi:hypothetical protein
VQEGRHIAFCRYHDVVGSAPVAIGGGAQFVQGAWARHLAEDCLIPMLERSSSEVRMNMGNGELIAMMVPIEAWRSLRAAIERADREQA